jgi:hypothetical protein
VTVHVENIRRLSRCHPCSGACYGLPIRTFFEATLVSIIELHALIFRMAQREWISLSLALLSQTTDLNWSSILLPLSMNGLRNTFPLRVILCFHSIHHHLVLTPAFSRFIEILSNSSLHPISSLDVVRIACVVSLQTQTPQQWAIHGLQIKIMCRSVIKSAHRTSLFLQRLTSGNIAIQVDPSELDPVVERQLDELTTSGTHWSRTAKHRQYLL